MLSWDYRNPDLYRYSKARIYLQKLNDSLLVLKDFYLNLNSDNLNPQKFFKIKLILINIDYILDDVKIMHMWFDSYGVFLNRLVDKPLKINRKWKFIQEKCDIIISLF